MLAQQRQEMLEKAEEVETKVLEKIDNIVESIECENTRTGMLSCILYDKSLNEVGNVDPMFSIHVQDGATIFASQGLPHNRDILTEPSTHKGDFMQFNVNNQNCEVHEGMFKGSLTIVCRKKSFWDRIRG